MERRPPDFVIPRDQAGLRKLILKLRWIGQEDEAEKLRGALGCDAPGLVCVDEPRVTD
ncbi:MAG TPA: hypothetical protein VMH86_03315 [Rhizomicrobium sp.]|nr:hypothetical protein [Rhizomicrobium sp.]